MPSFHSTSIVYIADDPTGDNQAFNRGYFISQGRSLLGIDTGDSVTFGGLTIGDYTFPITDGSNGQCLKTNGSGVLTWEAIGVATHGSSHVNGADDVPIVTASVKGLMPPNDQATELGTTGSPKFVKVSGNGGASGNLLLESTTNATKGKIYLGANSVYDEANDRLGINTNSPSQPLEVIGETNASAVGPLLIKSNGTGAVGVALTLDSTPLTNGHKWSFVSRGTGNFGFYDGTAGAYRVYIDKNGGVAIGTTVNGLPAGNLTVDKDLAVGHRTPSARLDVIGKTSDSSAYAVKIDNSSPEPALYVRNDKQVSTYGSRVKSYLIKTESYLISDSDPEIIYYNTDAVPLTSTFPASPTDGSIRFVKNTGSSSNNLTVARNGNLIDGAASDVTLPDGIGKYFQYTTAGWQMI